MILIIKYNLKQKFMKKLFIEPGCITCGACEFIAPDVFEVTDKSYIKTDADQEANKELIETAIRSCPVAVIKWQKKELYD